MAESSSYFREKNETSFWQAPPFWSDPTEIFSWVEEQIKEGEGWLAGQRAYKELSRNLKIFNAVFNDTCRSSLITNQLKYDIRKFCETLAQVREIAGYGSDHPAYKPMAEMLTRVSKAVYLESDFPFQILKVLQYASVMGIGYLWPKVRATEYGYGERRMEFDALGLLDVIPTQIPSRTNDIQDAYAVTVYDYMPIAEAHGRFPLFQSQIQTVGARKNYESRMQAQRVDFAESNRYGDVGRTFGNLYAEIRYTFVRDLRINQTGYELPMGDIGTSWFYRVPYVGQRIFGGMRNGAPYYIPAEAQHCRIYPNLRLIITSTGMAKPMYDGPAFDWDSRIPIIQYTVDDWAWEPLGRSIVGDVATIEQTIRKHERLMDQVFAAQANPPMGYNHTETGGPKIEHFDIFEPNVRLGVDGKPKETFQSILPDEVRIGSEHFNFLKYLNDKEGKQLGLEDLGNLGANMKLQIASDTADKMLESIGPVGKGIAARVEKANKAVGQRVKYLILQWFDTQRIMEYIGPEKIAPEIFDYKPNDLIPSHLPDELIGSGFPETESQYTQLERARWFVKQIRLVSVPSTLLKVTQMQQQLLLLQLKKGGAPISWLTIFKAMDINNAEQEITDSYKEQEQLEKMKLLAQIDLMQTMKKLGIDPAQLQGGEANSGKPHPGGRPPSNQKPPRAKMKGSKGGEPRNVVTTS
ncbi:unnamed protein product [Sphagnum jensenii]